MANCSKSTRWSARAHRRAPPAPLGRAPRGDVAGDRHPADDPAPPRRTRSCRGLRRSPRESAPRPRAASLCLRAVTSLPKNTSSSATEGALALTMNQRKLPSAQPDLGPSGPLAGPTAEGRRARTPRSARGRRGARAGGRSRPAAPPRSSRAAAARRGSSSRACGRRPPPRAGRASSPTAGPRARRHRPASRPAGGLEAVVGDSSSVGGTVGGRGGRPVDRQRPV